MRNVALRGPSGKLIIFGFFLSITGKPCVVFRLNLLRRACFEVSGVRPASHRHGPSSGPVTRGEIESDILGLRGHGIVAAPRT